ncbi:glycosyltransferase family 4 protein [Streptococcus parasuis]
MKKALIISTVSRQFYLFEQVNINILRKIGYEVHGVANFSDRSERLKEVNIIEHHVNFSRNPLSISNLFAFIKLLEIMRVYNFDLVHTHSPVGGVYGRLAAKICNVPQIIYTAHGLHFYKGSSMINWLLYYPIEKLLSYFTDKIILINEEDYDLAKSKLKTKQIYFVPGVGVNYSKFKPVQFEKKNLMRKYYGFAENDQILIYVGELSKRKNQSVLINAIAKIVKINPKVKLLLVGKGKLQSVYQKLIGNLNLQNNVLLLGYRDDIVELMQISDIAISSSLQEGLPVNLMEAMGVALPIVASNSRGNRDLVKDYENGILIKENTAEEWENIILKLFESPSRMKQFSVNSLDTASNYSEGKIKKIMMEVYNG